MTKDDLALIPLDELLEAVGERVDDFIFHGRKRLRQDDRGNWEHTYKRRQKGSHEAVIFLAAHAAHQVSAELEQAWEDPEPWEEF